MGYPKYWTDDVEVSAENGTNVTIELGWDGVFSVLPADGALNVPITAGINISAIEPFNTTAFNATLTGNLALQWNWSDDNKTVTFTNFSLEYNTTYTVTITGLANETILGGILSWSFTRSR